MNEIVADPTQSKRSKKEQMKSHVNVDDSPTTGSSEATAKRDKKRRRKAEAAQAQQPQKEQGSKGLLTSATMLSVVGLLNYMGNTAAQTHCPGGDG